MPADLFGGEGMVAEIEIMRGNLSRILYDATRDYTEYLFDNQIAGLTEEGDGVKVTFARGTVRRFDIVVGADGLHSGVRRLAFGPEQEFVRHLGGYMAYFTVPDPGKPCCKPIRRQPRPNKLPVGKVEALCGCTFRRSGWAIILSAWRLWPASLGAARWSSRTRWMTRRPRYAAVGSTMSWPILPGWASKPSSWTCVTTSAANSASVMI
jgi:hypothetical protein